MQRFGFVRLLSDKKGQFKGKNFTKSVFVESFVEIVFVENQFLLILITKRQQRFLNCNSTVTRIQNGRE